MTKKQLKIRLWLTRVGFALVAILGLGGLAHADGLFSWVNVEDKVADRLASQASVASAPQEKVLGASSPFQLGPMECVNDDCTYHATVALSSATDTAFALATPFLMSTTTNSDVVVTRPEEYVNGLGQTGATSTVTLVRVYATSSPATTYTIVCGGASASTTAPTYNLLSSDNIPSSTIGIVENGIASSQGTNIGGGSVLKSMLGPTYPWLVCKARPVGPFATYNYPFAANATATLSGYVEVNIKRTQRSQF